MALLLATLRMYEFSSPDFAIDDAWISFRIARNWLEAGKLTFDLTQPPVEGMTNFLWTLLSALWIAPMPEVDPIFAARAVGGLCHLGTVGVAAWLAARLAHSQGGSARTAALVTGVLLAASGSMAFHALSGLETSLYTLLFVLAMERALAARSGRGGPALACGVLLGLLGMTRPEGVLTGLLFLGLMALWPETRRGLWRTALPFALLIGGLELYRWRTYGALVPNTYHAKPPDPTDGWNYFQSYALYGLGLVGPVALVPALRRGAFARGMALVALVLAAGTIWSGGDWMPGYRRFTLTMAAVAVLAGAGVALARGAWRIPAVAGAVAVLAGHLGASLMLQDAGLYPTRALASLAFAANATPGVRTVALTDIGRFGYFYSGSILDLAGLTDAHIARQAGSHMRKEWDEAYFLSRRPDLLIVDSTSDLSRPETRELRVHWVETGALQSIQRRGGYHLVTSLDLQGGKYLLILARDGLELPEDVWGPRTHRTLSEFSIRAM
ncbi:hypothetical protein [Vitiosangium sp. GDMCC 1.1324]|uniref:hypothetical protein n=1 Tax=Vitiosangium sp. (strain GDMCC 1.1324) TaxID=2138576 RepID=UPI000D3B884F|nr:hypothetical protein [Vitiosangium sp. GDMCC 1.1324]PTL78603.1 hypothetical protein DAT35_39480 [Vitiosangium sp. GDMCC 1.1324]